MVARAVRAPPRDADVDALQRYVAITNAPNSSTVPPPEFADFLSGASTIRRQGGELVADDFTVESASVVARFIELIVERTAEWAVADGGLSTASSFALNHRCMRLALHETRA